FRRLKAHIGAPKALTAAAYKLARILYRMLKYGAGYVDQGEAAYEERYRDRLLRNLKRRPHSASNSLRLIQTTLNSCFLIRAGRGYLGGSSAEVLPRRKSSRPSCTHIRFNSTFVLRPSGLSNLKTKKREFSTITAADAVEYIVVGLLRNLIRITAR